MAQRQSQTRTRTTAQITFDHNDPAVFASRVGEAIHARMNPAHELSAPARQYANMRLPDVVREVSKRHGIAVQGLSDSQVFTRAGSMVTGDLAGILGDSAGRSLRTACDAAPSGLRPAARQTQYPNFKVQTKYMLGDAPALKKVLEGGEYPMGSVAESANTNTLSTFGSIIPYARQMWINDDLGALADFSRRMGIASREFENAQLATALTSNPIMGDGLAVFVAGHGNLDAASAPSVKLSDTPEAANTLMKRLRLLLGFAVQIGMIAANPMTKMESYAANEDGYHTWTEKEIAQFMERHPHGTKAYLALMLMLNTGQRKSDAIRMGWGNVNDGMICVRQQKTGTSLMIPIIPELQEALAILPKDAPTFLVTEHGRPYSVAGFGNWMRDRCNEAGLSNCSSHGLRKACARRLAERGCTHHEIKAITGHKTDAEVRRYTAKADQVRLAHSAFEKLQHTANNPKPANPL